MHACTHLHVVVVLPVDDRDEAERAGVHVALGRAALVGETVPRVEAHEEVSEAVVSVQRVVVAEEGRASRPPRVSSTCTQA